MNRQHVTSSNIVSIGYDPDTSTLEVEFRNAQVYQYADVPQAIYDDLMEAQSIGSFMYQYVIGTYSSTRQ